MQDLMALKQLGEKDGMTPYEQFMVSHKESKKPSGLAITGAILGGTALFGVATSWIFGGLYSNAKSKEAKEAAYGAEKVANTQYNAALALMTQQNQNTQANLDRLIATVATERQERIAGDVTMSQTINDTISGQQSAAQSAQVSQTSAVDNVVTQSMYQAWNDAISGKSSPNPQPVMIYSAPQPCACPGCGCGQ